ncbi:AN1-type zinc finger protein 2B [Dromiciops gliroides]|uniref:AN1-type zinc finger protein 2B n=1 Tax=Dromiciops gliroides TaxID=33562 RepID=UPI001CC5324B|nr:AN1-type zinc finger protein 2B [Dromiciops gliroides]
MDMGRKAEKPGDYGRRRGGAGWLRRGREGGWLSAQERKASVVVRRSDVTAAPWRRKGAEPDLQSLQMLEGRRCLGLGSASGGSGRKEWTKAEEPSGGRGEGLSQVNEASRYRAILADFLPLKCDACSGIFCADHVAYDQHHCDSAYKKDVQVPVCPLCNVPVPVARGESPDRAVGEHIDRDCRSDPAQRKRKIFTNKCTRPGCRQREMMELTCERCGRNFCLKHRHPLDHECPGKRLPSSQTGLAAISRAQGLGSSPAPVPGPGLARTSPPSQSRVAESPTHALQNGLSEDEALQQALILSLTEAKPIAPSTQEEEDLALAQALSASEEEYRKQQAQSQSRSLKPSNCSIC